MLSLNLSSTIQNKNKKNIFSQFIKKKIEAFDMLIYLKIINIFIAFEILISISEDHIVYLM